MDAEYVKMGEDSIGDVKQLLAFGDPLVVDSALDNNGGCGAVHAAREQLPDQGRTNQILGFVTLCDFFPRSPLTLPDNTVIPACRRARS